MKAIGEDFFLVLLISLVVQLLITILTVIVLILIYFSPVLFST